MDEIVTIGDTNALCRRIIVKDRWIHWKFIAENGYKVAAGNSEPKFFQLDHVWKAN